MLFLALSSAFALDCDEVVRMVEVGVPTSIVVDAVLDSGAHLPDTAALTCLRARGVPEDIVVALEVTTAAATPAVAPAPRGPPAATPAKGR